MLELLHGCYRTWKYNTQYANTSGNSSNEFINPTILSNAISKNNERITERFWIPWYYWKLQLHASCNVKMLNRPNSKPLVSTPPSPTLTPT